MDIEEAIVSRRSIRRYASKKINKEDILKILEVALWAPSACNRQAHKVIYIENKKTKQELVDLGAAAFIKNASAVLLFLYDDIGDNTGYRDDIQSSSALIENFLLLCHAKGYGACWTCHLPSKNKLRKIFGIPRGINPIAAVSIGYKVRQPIVVQRKQRVEQIFFEERLPTRIKVHDRNLALFVKRILRKAYYLLPGPILKKLYPYVDNFFVRKFDN